ncbi:MAG: hypothetical protein COZ96_00970 [Nitrospirae bacterium CG_4_8_14_3_um_filter_70_85]|nr:MAG: hypothetical protein COS73_11080 [Nitrospirae bacterium CG06_land_8_20_14_3_00_70_43]PIW83891.1 MAG: hypothetical protein COZ96_00970 [Nitrospirae bacterium CG_4_8_14_3_um_filter_70_85]PIX82803.1 MAG: hypothetical protein COZ33_08730 [Nitrospirae bacterium CG_4_10_14_3_um_filter_70_108]PJB94744.1 MAG: hypothetical protein CO080_11510 [Nitrospirae bacterium CG_4_9_14_0_8_um_filter_70_14]
MTGSCVLSALAQRRWVVSCSAPVTAPPPGRAPWNSPSYRYSTARVACTCGLSIPNSPTPAERARRGWVSSGS